MKKYKIKLARHDESIEVLADKYIKNERNGIYQFYEEGVNIFNILIDMVGEIVCEELKENIET